MRWLTIVAVLALVACSSTATRTTIHGSPVVDASPLGSATGKPGASPSAAHSKAADLHITSLVLTQLNGGVRFMGEVVNQGGAIAAGIQLNVTARDAAGNVLSSSNAGLIRPLIPAGESSPYAGVLFNVLLTDIASHEPTLQFISVGPNDYPANLYTTALTITQFEWTAAHIVGAVHNDGTKPVSLVHIIAAGYAADGTLDRIQDGFAALSQIAPGDTSPFDIGIQGRDAPPATYKVYVIADKGH